MIITFSEHFYVLVCVARHGGWSINWDHVELCSIEPMLQSFSKEFTRSNEMQGAFSKCANNNGVHKGTWVIGYKDDRTISWNVLRPFDTDSSEERLQGNAKYEFEDGIDHVQPS